MPSLSEDELIEEFEACTLAPAAFPHREHVRLAWAYLRRETLAEAIVEVLRRIEGVRRAHRQGGAVSRDRELGLHADHSGPDRSRPEWPSESWEAFAAANEDLLQNGRQLLERYYLPVTLDSPLARATFIWPDRSVSDRMSPAAPSDRYRA